MKRIASRGIVLTALAVLAMSGQAAAFTPVPIPTPRIGNSAAATLMPISALAHTSGVEYLCPVSVPASLQRLSTTPAC